MHHWSGLLGLVFARAALPWRRSALKPILGIGHVPWSITYLVNPADLPDSQGSRPAVSKKRSTALFRSLRIALPRRFLSVVALSDQAVLQLATRARASFGRQRGRVSEFIDWFDPASLFPIEFLCGQELRIFRMTFLELFGISSTLEQPPCSW
jgi:hypothetical protein